MAERTRRMVAAEAFGLLLMILETVAAETPALLATSAIDMTENRVLGKEARNRRPGWLLLNW
jgi:hypothetical protein